LGSAGRPNHDNTGAGLLIDEADSFELVESGNLNRLKMKKSDRSSSARKVTERSHPGWLRMSPHWR
jgi:hypothetical protein